MDNLTPLRIAFNNRQTQPDLDSNCGAIILLTPNGDPARIHIANNGWLYVNGVPFGVGGMPPAPHQITHIKGGNDAISPEDIGAVNDSRLVGIEDTPTTESGKIPLTANDGRIPAAYINMSEVPTIEEFLQLKADFMALKEMAVLSENIKLINGKTLTDGVGSLEYTEK